MFDLSTDVHRCVTFDPMWLIGGSHMLSISSKRNGASFSIDLLAIEIKMQESNHYAGTTSWQDVVTFIVLLFGALTFHGIRICSTSSGESLRTSRR